MLNTAAQILTSGIYGIILGEMVTPLWTLGALFICIGTYLVQDGDLKDKKSWNSHENGSFATFILLNMHPAKNCQ